LLKPAIFYLCFSPLDYGRGGRAVRYLGSNGPLGDLIESGGKQIGRRDLRGADQARHCGGIKQVPPL
jgi:hypothetical protein